MTSTWLWDSSFNTPEGVEGFSRPLTATWVSNRYSGPWTGRFNTPEGVEGFSSLGHYTSQTFLHPR